MDRTRRILELALALTVAIAVAAAIRRFLDRGEAGGGELPEPRTEPVSIARRNGDAPSAGGDSRPTRDQLYSEAQRLGIKGRSKMKKQELQQAVEAAKTGGTT